MGPNHPPRFEEGDRIALISGPLSGPGVVEDVLIPILSENYRYEIRLDNFPEFTLCERGRNLMPAGLGTKEDSKLETEPKFRVGDIIRVKRFDVTGEITFVNTIDDRTLYVILVKDDASEIRMSLYESEIERIGYNKVIIERINSEFRELLNDQSPLREDIISKIETRFKKGDETYGQGVDIYDKRYNWVDMAEEELLDCLVYIVAETMRNGIRKNLRTAFYNVVHALLSLSEGGR